MSQLDPNIILSGNQFQAPDLMKSGTKAMNYASMQQEFEQNKLAAEDNAKMSGVLKTMNPNDPMYDVKAVEALVAAGVSPTKVLAFKKDQLGIQSEQAGLELKKVQASEATRKAMVGATTDQLTQMGQTNGLIANTTKDVVETYDSIMAKGGESAKSTAMSAAKTLFDNHIAALLNDPTIPEPLKKMIAAQKEKPFNIDEIRNLFSQSETHQRMLKEEEERRKGVKEEAQVGEIKARTEEHLAKAGAATAKGDAAAAAAPGAQSDFVKDAMAAFMEKQGPAAARLTKNSQAQTIQNIETLHKKYPDLTPAQIVEKVVTGSIDTKAAAATEKEFDTGKAGQTVQSLNVAIQHFGQLSELTKDLNNNPLQVTNAIKNWAKEKFGDSSVTNFDTAKAVVGKEFVKAIVANGGGVEERREMEAIFSNIKSPEQLQGAIKQAKGLLAGQLKGAEKRYMSSMDPDGLDQEKYRKRFRSKLLPETIAELSEDGGHGDKSKSGGVDTSNKWLK